jgi:choline dehydrogenase
MSKNRWVRKETNMYDYSIVGAGSAGCVLANRLTEDPETSVLVLEAGGNDDLPAIHDPAATTTLRQSAVDWAYSTEEEPHLNNRKISVPRGKVLGGSSSINFMVYVRGNRADYDQWQALGNQGWSYADVLPYFKKIENYEGRASDYRSRGGPLTVTNLPSINPLTEAFIEAGEELGWLRNDDPNGASQEGFGTFQLTIGQGKRQSTAVGYLHPAQSRPNLTVWTQTLTTRVLFEGTRAVGVAYLKDGVEHQVRVKKEVILSGGVINSPQLLLLSGVGPSDQLQALAIPVVADVPGVGHHLQDHLGIEMYFKTKPSFTQFGTISEGVAFVKTQPGLAEPDIELMLSPFFLFPVAPGNGYSVTIVLVTPQSQGHVTLRSTDPTKPPAIYANYLAHETDQQKLINGIKLARRLSQTTSLAHFTDVEALPGSQAQSEREILEYVREHARSIDHFIGSCKMGHDDLAVVDDQLRVHGVEGLRVVDASIMPTTVRGNTNAPTIMIAEKGADLIAHHVQ